MSSFTFHRQLPSPQDDVVRVWEAINAIDYEQPDVHVACNQWWYEKVVVSRLYTPGPASIYGYNVFVTDDIDNASGYEIRAGKNPGVDDEGTHNR